MNDDSPWQYKPDGKQAAQAPDLPNSGAGRSAAPQTVGQSVSWTASEYIDHSRGSGWYLGLIAATAAVGALLYLFTKDYFATGVIVAAGIIVAVFSTHKPRQVEYELSATGLKAGAKSYPINIFRSFAINREGAVSSVTLIPTKRFMPPLSVYLEPADEPKIVAILGEHLPIQEGGLDTIERLSRRLRL